MVLCALGTWNNNFPGRNFQHLHGIRSLPQENIKKYKALDHPFHSTNLFHGIFLPFPRQMGLHSKTRDCVGEWGNCAVWSNNSTPTGKPKGVVELWTIYEKQFPWELFFQKQCPQEIIPNNMREVIAKNLSVFFYSKKQKKTYRPLSGTFIFLIVVYCSFFFDGHNGAPLFYASTLCERMSFLFIYLLLNERALKGEGVKCISFYYNNYCTFMKINSWYIVVYTNLWTW